MGVAKSVEYNVRVYYEDVDLGGIVYHSKYLNFCERARSELFFSNARSPVEGEYHFVVKHIDADFVAPAKFGELLSVHTLLVSRKKASFTLRQTVCRKEEMKKLYEMDVQLVCMKGQKVAPIPSGMTELFETD